MILTVDIGNTTIQGCLFEEGQNVLTFRRATNPNLSSDEIGLFFRDVIKLNGYDYKSIKSISCCSVVPSLNHSVSNACKKYFGQDGLFVQAGVKTGLKLKYANPREIGADRIAACIGGRLLVSDQNLIVIDMGTATTIEAVTKSGEYLGGAILPGVKMSATSLASGTAKLPTVEILKPENSCGTSTIEAIQSGIYFSHVGAIKQLIENFTNELFAGEKPYIIATGGFCKLFEKENLFDRIVSDLVHLGLIKILELNKNAN